MAETDPKTEPTEPTTPASEDDVWKRVEGIVESAVGKALKSWVPSKTSSESSPVPSTPEKPESKKLSFLEKLISG
jgi:hypothetical protein